MTNPLRPAEICASALSLAGERRAAFLDGACGSDPELRREVDRLLAASPHLDEFLAVPAWHHAAGLLADASCGDAPHPEGTDDRPAEARLPAGARLGPYVIESVAGAGGMGEVYRARDTRLARPVAIKVLRASLADDADRRRRFLQEARAVSGLNHPHICPLFDIGEAIPVHGGVPLPGSANVSYLVMAYLEGETLATRLARGALPLAQALEIGAQLADALSAAHRAGLVHRDVKPANVMVSKAGGSNGGPHATLLDFGLAKLRAHGERPLAALASTTAPPSVPVTVRGMILGTLPYMAPEQVEGQDADARTDLWALGAVIYEMVSGARAFDGRSAASLIVSILEHEPPPLSARQPITPPALDRVVSRCLAKEPDARWESARDVADELRWIAQDSRATGPRHPIRRMPMRRRVALAGGVVVTAALVAGGLAAIGPLRSPRLPESVSTQITFGPLHESEPAISPDGNTLAFVADDGREQSIWLVPTRGGRASPWTQKPGHHRYPAWAPDGRILFESEDGAWRGIFVAEAIDSRTAVPLAKDARHPAVSPDGRRLAFARTGSSGYLRLVVTDLGNLGAETTLTTDQDGRWDHTEPAWSPDGDRLCYGSADGLWVVAANGRGRPTQLTRGTYVSRPVWSTSGYIYFGSPRDGGDWSILRVSSSGGSPQLVDMGVGPEQMPALSADGSILAFSAGVKRTGVVVRDLVSGTERPLGGEGDGTLPSYAHDGRSVYFLLNAWGRAEIWTQTLADGLPTARARPFPLFGPTQPPSVYSQAAPSPDGAWLAVMGRREDARDVYVVSSTGGLAVDVSGDPTAADYHPAWSPDNSQLAFVSERNGKQRVWIRSVASGRGVGDPRRLTAEDDLEFELFPTWSPDGSRVAFVGGVGDRSEVYDADAKTPRPPRALTIGADSFRVKWSARSGWLFTVDRLSGNRFVLRAFDPDRRGYVPAFGNIDVGTDDAFHWFDVSPDERYVALVRGRNEGRIAVAKTQRGRY